MASQASFGVRTEFPTFFSFKLANTGNHKKHLDSVLRFVCVMVLIIDSVKKSYAGAIRVKRSARVEHEREALFIM